MAVAMPIVDAAALFRDAGLKVVETGLEHGTVTVVSDGEAIEVTQTRVDLDTDGRHATVAFSDDWRADAARRDARGAQPGSEAREAPRLGGIGEGAAARVEPLRAAHLDEANRRQRWEQRGAQRVGVGTEAVGEARSVEEA